MRRTRSQYLDLCFLARATSREAAARARVADDESTDVAWFAPDAVPAELAPSSRERVGHALGWLASGSDAPFFVR